MDALPQWTSKIDKRGLDPLGMQNSGIVLYQALLPGISNITLRMRYYGFFCWLGDAYARRGVTTDFELWRQFVRRAETLYALVCADATGEVGIGGIDWADHRLQVGEDVIDFAEAASNDKNVTRYLIQSMGVFGAAYVTQMQEMGLFEEGPNGIQRITADAGVLLANAFRASIGPEVEARFVAAIDAGKVARDALASLHAIIPSAIPDTSEERASYEKTLFGNGDNPMVHDVSRGATLRLLLEVARVHGERPTPESVRWALFDPPGRPLAAELERQRLLWEAYHCQDLFQVAAAGLLAWAISIMSESDNGQTLADIRAAVHDRLLDREELASALSWNGFRTSIDIGAFGWREAWLRLTGRRGSAEEKAWDAVQLIASLHERVDDREDLRQILRSALRANERARSIVTELRWFDQQPDTPVAELIVDYVVQRIVLRHSWVAMQKFRRQRDYTFLFEVRDGRLIYLNHYQPVATTPRLAPALQFLEDIHLVAVDGLTERGRALLGANQ